MTRYRLRIAKSARRQIDTVHAWWLENRPAARALFEDELEAVLDRARTHPAAGAPFPNPEVDNVRRLLMVRCRYYVYYATEDAARVVTVMAVWHAARGSGPLLA